MLVFSSLVFAQSLLVFGLFLTMLVFSSLVFAQRNSDYGKNIKFLDILPLRPAELENINAKFGEVYPL